MNIGNQIKNFRKAKKLTQEQLAEYLGVTSQAVSKWETGVSAPDIDMLPRLAIFFHTSVDELLDYHQQQIDQAVDQLVRESLPLRKNPAQAEAFYRKALQQYPNNEVLLNCLLMTIDDGRSQEKLEIGEHLLECTTDDAIKYDVVRLMAETYHAIGEQAMAEHYLSQIPELYFLQTEIAAAIKTGAAQHEEIVKTEDVCLGTLISMLTLRISLTAENEKRAGLQEIGRDLLTIYQSFPEHCGTHQELWEAPLPMPPQT